jgi:hypothetical protein
MHSPVRDHTVGDALNNSGPPPREIAYRRQYWWSLSLGPVHQVGSYEKRHDKETNGDRLSHVGRTDNADH